ncbi:hypothetical protein [Nocardioides sp.]|uniref:hypothetical protein n=1 Tax=Nocardioides sp. TaxID=35761 RepID=UPI00263443D5|nr:hypothetical protein [Nocardioides sp.]MCW2738268.1 rhamnulokinase [Nocardioides sp.]
MVLVDRLVTDLLAHGLTGAEVAERTNASTTGLLSETRRTWGRDDLGALLAAAADVTGPVPVFDVQDPRFVPPGDMPGRITAWCAEYDVAPPADDAGLVRSVVESLAAAYADAGPVEATALGNVLVQGRAAGAVHGGLDELRDLVARSHDLRRHEPRTRAWKDAEL